MKKRKSFIKLYKEYKAMSIKKQIKNLLKLAKKLDKQLLKIIKQLNTISKEAN